jgi:hypothetical protein
MELYSLFEKPDAKVYPIESLRPVAQCTTEIGLRRFARKNKIPYWVIFHGQRVYSHGQLNYTGYYAHGSFKPALQTVSVCME